MALALKFINVARATLASECMVTILVRSRKDRDAVAYAIDRFYGGDPAIRIATLGGVRKCDEIAYRASEEAKSVSDAYIMLLGKESADCLPLLETELPPNVFVHIVPRKKVRNLRIEHLAWEIARAKSLIRTTVFWVQHATGYAFYRYSRGVSLGIEPDPAYDTFLVMDRGAELLSSISRVSCRLPLLVRMYGGEHLVYCCHRPICRITIPDELAPIRSEPLEPHHRCSPSLNATLDINLEISRLVVDRGASIVRKFTEGFSKVVVPFSGGKDSTLALYIATRAIDPSKVTAVYVDTGVEFPLNREYVEKIASELGVELVKLRAPVRDEIIRRGELPSHRCRWCTELKVAALERYVRSLGDRIAVIVGDRDSESRSRSWRPSVRDSEGVRYIAPIKPWSTAQIQATLINVGIEPNPLYLLGFYRVGCYVCPSLRAWELEVIHRNPRFFRDVLLDDLFKRFEQLKAKTRSKQLRDACQTST
ncbi:MAG: phosphoadenosine phosphosulfate reductase family protein [Crenarchaeota archaeon]|nr:phosphoadenosine phosphosulfate reductase family protein [Thermoproteota archaeon]